MDQFERRLQKASPIKTEEHFFKHKSFKVKYVKPKNIEPFFGYAFNEIAYVRADLPSRASRFVCRHELCHLTDSHTWWGWFGSELRANARAGVRDPMGFGTTVFLSLKRYRFKLYWELLKKRSPQ